MNYPPRYVYLAGPITDSKEDEANDWRRYVADKLIKHGIVGISPLRCEPISGERYTATHADPRFGTARAICAKNVFDIRTCDMTIAYFPKPVPGKHASYGTIGEVCWAYILGKHAVAVSDDSEIIAHPVVNSCAGWMLSTLDEAIDVVVGVLGGYVGGKNV